MALTTGDIVTDVGIALFTGAASLTLSLLLLRLSRFGALYLVVYFSLTGLASLLLRRALSVFATSGIAAADFFRLAERA